MASANDVTDEEQRRALQRETRLVTLLEAARETKWSLYDIEGPRLYTSRDASDRLVESLAFDLKLSRLRRNDKDIVLISSGCFPPGYGEPLGDALSHNTKVTTLSLDTKDFLPLEDQNVFQATQPWRDFLAVSSSVVNVRVRHNGDQVANEVVTILLETVCGSNVIQNLCLKNRPVSPREFKSLMTAPKSLQELEIHFANQRQRWTDKDKRCVTKGIKSNQNRLQRLALYVDADESDGIRNEEDTMTAHVLKNLYLVQSLQALHLEFDELYEGMLKSPFGVLDIFSALEHYLQSVDTLRQLGLMFVHIDEALMTKLLSGLGQTTAGVQRIAVSELSFACGSFDAGSLSLLFAFLQTPTTDENGRTVYKSALRQLHFGVRDPDFSIADELDDSCWESLAESLLMQSSTTSSGMVQTIGSQIEELYIEHVSASFLRHVSINASRLCVKHLGLYWDVPDNISACLPKLVSMTSLALKFISEPEPLDAVVEGLKHNGSITAISSGHAFDPFYPTDWDGTAHSLEFDEKRQRLMNAYVQRNKFLSKYYIRQTPSTDDTHGTTASAPIDASHSDCGPLQVEVSQLPSILRTAMTGPGVSHLLHGLVKGGEHVGPHAERATATTWWKHGTNRTMLRVVMAVAAGVVAATMGVAGTPTGESRSIPQRPTKRPLARTSDNNQAKKRTRR